MVVVLFDVLYRNDNKCTLKETNMAVQNDRGIVLKTKLILGERIWRKMTKPAAAILRKIPDSVKYSAGTMMRKSNYPYRVIEENDVVFQIGCPRDLLSVGRSRSVYFLRLVSGNGKLVVMEPDPKNCAAIEAFAAKHGLSEKLIVVPAGGWDEEKELEFYESPEHPASAVLVELCQATPEEMKRRGYSKMTVPVTTVDKVRAKHNLPVPKLVSSTTNGAEIQIMKGMAETFKEGPEYISLAITGSRYREELADYNYEYIADDDRGFTFRRGQSV